MAEITLPHAEKTRFAGYSDDQVLMLFERIASMADLLCDVCRTEGGRAGLHESASVFHSLSHMASGIGALADLPTGGGVVGGFEEWFMGPLFKDRAKVRTANETQPIGGRA